MAYLIGSADTTRFSSTLAINSGASGPFMIQYYGGRNDDPANAVATGTADILDLYISDWGTQSSIKVNIYDETGGGVLVESVIVPSSVGTGLVSVAMAGTATITSGRLYRRGIYTQDENPVTFFSDTSGLTLRNENTEGNYTTPSDPSILGSFVSFNEFYWAIQSSTGGPSISSTTTPAVDGVQSSITTSGLTGTPTTTLGGYIVTTAGTLPNLTYTLAISVITATGPVSVPRIGDSLTLSVTGTEGAATSTVATSPATGYAAVTLAGTLATEADGLIDQIQNETNLTVAVGDIIYYPTADNTEISTTGVLTTDSELFSMLLIQGGNATTAGSGYGLTVVPPAADEVIPAIARAVRAVVRPCIRSSIAGINTVVS